MSKPISKPKMSLFQKQMLAVLTEKKVVILQISTGSGKTKDALALFLRDSASKESSEDKL